MPRRRTWTREEEKLLVRLAEEGCGISEMAGRMKKTYASVAAKMKRLGVSVDDNDGGEKNLRLLSSTLKLPDNLPSIEDQLRVLAAVIDMLQTPGLDKDEVMRLRTIINGIRAYKEQFSDYVGYREIEEKVEKLIRELRGLEGAEGMEGAEQQNKTENI